MSYLLDTHTLLWWLEDNPNLSEAAREIISNKNNLIFVSPISTWEISIKKALGKLNSPDNIEKIILDSGFSALNINISHTTLIEQLENHHEDPFDRLLIAQATIEKLTIITKDKKIAKYNVPVIIT